MNEANKASPNSLRNKFGIVKATTKADPKPLVPRKKAISISRTNPKTLLTNVSPKVPADFKRHLLANQTLLINLFHDLIIQKIC